MSIARCLLLFFSIFMASFPMMAQTDTAEVVYSGDEFAAAFSAEGVKQWKPEFTVRSYAGIYTGGCELTGGVKIDNKRTLGLMLGYESLYVDAAPGDVRAIGTAAFFRRYIHLGKKERFSLYSDLYLGASWIFKATGNTEQLNSKPGEVYFLIGWQPGIRLRIYRNFQIFLGPTISTYTMGLHLGLGF